MKKSKAENQDKIRTKSGHGGENQDKIRTKSGQKKPAPKFSKTDARYWRGRVVRRTAEGTYHLRLQMGGRDVWFDTLASNLTDASTKARDVYFHAKANGLAAALAEYKKQDPPMPAKEIKTVGELVAAFETFEVPIRPETLKLYLSDYRQLAAEIGMPKRTAAKYSSAKYDYRGGGRQKWLDAAHRVPLSVLTLDAVAEWRKAKNPTTAATILRQAKSLFSENVLPCDTTAAAEARKAFLSRLPPGADLAGIRVKATRPVRHKTQAELDGDTLAALARKELRDACPAAYKAFLLTYYGGLRRKEADCLLWSQVDRKNMTLTVTANAYFRPKTAAGDRTVDLEAGLIAELERGRDRNDPFVIGLGKRHPLPLADQYANYYRAEAAWACLLEWLKSKGLGRKAVHYLRKESGSAIADSFGIEAARLHLGHADIAVTSAHYSDKRSRHTVKMKEAE